MNFKEAKYVSELVGKFTHIVVADVVDSVGQNKTVAMLPFMGQENGRPAALLSGNGTNGMVCRWFKDLPVRWSVSDNCFVLDRVWGEAFERQFGV